MTDITRADEKNMRVFNTPGAFATICESGDIEQVRRLLKDKPDGFVITKECFIRAGRNGHQATFDALLFWLHVRERQQYQKDPNIFEAVCAGNLTQILEWPVMYDSNKKPFHHWATVLYAGVINGNKTTVSRAIIELKKIGLLELFFKKYTDSDHIKSTRNLYFEYNHPVAKACRYDMRNFISAYLLYRTVTPHALALKEVLVYAARFSNNDLFKTIVALCYRFCLIRSYSIAHDSDIFEAAHKAEHKICDDKCPHTKFYPEIWLDPDIFEAACLGYNEELTIWFLKSDKNLAHACKQAKKVHEPLPDKDDHTGEILLATYDTWINYCLDKMLDDELDDALGNLMLENVDAEKEEEKKEEAGEEEE